MIIIKSLLVVVYCSCFIICLAESQSLNQFCYNRNDCGSSSYICGTNKTCQCDKFFIPNKNGDKCVGTIGQKCKYDEHCIDGAYCDQQIICKCKENLYPSEDKLTCSAASRKIIYFLNIFFILFIKF